MPISSLINNNNKESRLTIYLQHLGVKSSSPERFWLHDIVESYRQGFDAAVLSMFEYIDPSGADIESMLKRLRDTESTDLASIRVQCLQMLMRIAELENHNISHTIG